VYAATNRERHTTKTAFERSLFTKLALAYVANTVALPLVVGSVPFGVTQAWYESGGPVEQAQLLLLSGALFTELYKVLQPVVLFDRLVRVKWVASQLGLNRLYAPPPMMLGELYAQAVKVMALCLFYAPLYAPMYALTALALLGSLFGSRAALSVWWGRPPMVGADLIRRLRLSLALLIGVHLAVGFFAERRAAPDAALSSTALPPLLMGVGCWVVYVLAPAHRLTWLAEHDALELTTEDFRYDEVTSHEMERYRGLAATRSEESGAELEDRALGAEGIGGFGAKYKLQIAAAANFLSAVEGRASAGPGASKLQAAANGLIFSSLEA